MKEILKKIVSGGVGIGITPIFIALIILQWICYRNKRKKSERQCHGF